MRPEHPDEDAKLAAHDPDTIRRLITNQKHEHTPHAFRAGSSGMKDYNRLVPVLRSLPPDELVGWLKLIDQVGYSHRGCQPCTCKVRAYLILITKDIRLICMHTTCAAISHTSNAGRRTRTVIFWQRSWPRTFTT